MRLLDRLRRTIPVHACSGSEFDDLPMISFPLCLPRHDGDMAEIEHLMERLGLPRLTDARGRRTVDADVFPELHDDLAIELDIDDTWPASDDPIPALLDEWRDQLDATEAAL